MKINKRSLGLLIILISHTLFACNNISVGQHVIIPPGYNLIDIDDPNNIWVHQALFLQHRKSGLFYLAEDGQVVEQIIVPQGYNLYRVSWCGQTNARTRKYYCQRVDNNVVYECEIKFASIK